MHVLGDIDNSSSRKPSFDVLDYACCCGCVPGVSEGASEFPTRFDASSATNSEQTAYKVPMELDREQGGDQETANWRCPHPSPTPGVVRFLFGADVL